MFCFIQVIIIDSNFPDHPIGFTCHKWLSATEGDFKTYKLLYPTTSGVNDDDNNNSYRRKSNAIRGEYISFYRYRYFQILSF